MIKKYELSRTNCIDGKISRKNCRKFGFYRNIRHIEQKNSGEDDTIRDLIKEDAIIRMEGYGNYFQKPIFTIRKKIMSFKIFKITR